MVELDHIEIDLGGLSQHYGVIEETRID